MSKGRPIYVVTKALRGTALGLAKRFLEGEQRREAEAWIRDQHRTTAHLSGFIKRMNAAHRTGEPNA